ncbi:MAG: GH3 auxin-responsive promoter family protein [Bacteroidetes bacterium]|nr:GH3 auxin-responsive promoter family protein [Bacteroidota bacterium]
MSISSGIYSWLFKKRLDQLELMRGTPLECQSQTLTDLLAQALETQFGKDHHFDRISGRKEFVERVPIRSYEDIKPYIMRAMEGAEDVLWPGKVKWFAKSSGTTHDRSKFLPITQDALENCHFQGGKDLLGVHLQNHPDSLFLDGRSLTLGGSHSINQLNEHSFYGDLSAILTQNLPIWAELLRTPDLKTALHPNYEEKIEMLAQKTINRNVTNIVGVPTWTVVLFNRILDITGKDHITEVWPNLELYIHGGVSFEPYRELFKLYIPKESMSYVETYNASEGFFAFQDQPNDDGLLLMLDYGIYYEFLPLEEEQKPNPRTLALEEVELNKQYALVISTNAGLWRYKIGDTIKFTSLYPFRIKVTGRTRHFINAFGEELIIENAELALAKACVVHRCSVKDFTAGPVYFEGRGKGAHEWLIEFDREPEHLESFVSTLDKALCEANTDYEAKRKGDMALTMPRVQAVPSNTFYNWLKWKGKLGGQHKVPRLSNDRRVLDELIRYLQTGMF